jgi:hypothetical protein
LLISWIDELSKVKKKLMNVLLATLFTTLFSLVVPFLAPSAVAWDDPTEGEECGPAGFYNDLTQIGGGLFKCLRFKQGNFYLDLTKRSSMTENYRGETFKGVKCSKAGSWGFDYLTYDFLQCANVKGSLKFIANTINHPLDIPTRIQTVSPTIVSGAKCSKAGEIKSSSGKKLVCARSNGKLIWMSMNAAPSNKPTASPSPKCEPSSTSVKISLGQAASPDARFLFQSINLENLSDCNIVVLVSAGADCKIGRPIEMNKYVVPINTTISLAKRQKLSILASSLEYFPTALLLCENLTGFTSSTFQYATNLTPTAVVLSSR